MLRFLVVCCRYLPPDLQLHEKTENPKHQITCLLTNHEKTAVDVAICFDQRCELTFGVRERQSGNTEHHLCRGG